MKPLPVAMLTSIFVIFGSGVSSATVSLIVKDTPFPARPAGRAKLFVEVSAGSLFAAEFFLKTRL